MAKDDSSLRAVPFDEMPPRLVLSILDLPTDILRNVFEYFQDDSFMSKGSLNWHCCDRSENETGIVRRQTICSSRLVCWIFYDLATPMLCPILRVQLDQASLDRLNNISHSPRLAESIHGIQVVLSYRPKELAADLCRYKACRLKELGKMADRCSYYEETWYLGGDDTDDETVCPLPHREYVKALSNYRQIRHTWSKAIDPNERDANEDEIPRRVEEEDASSETGDADDAVKDNKSRECINYLRVLLQGHETYQKLHEEQLRLITNGSFVTSLAASMARMIHADSLRFVDNTKKIPNPRVDNPTLLFTDVEELRRFMTEPHDWATIEELGEGAEVLPAKLLSELPIAIHKAGMQLRDVNVDCFPVRKDQSMVCPDGQDKLNPAWADLRAACQSISRFGFGAGNGSLHHKPMRYNHLPAEDQDAMDRYLGAMLSGQSLEDVNVSFYAFGINNGGGGYQPYHRIGKMLEAASWPRIRKLKIGNGALNHSELEKFCTGLGYALENLYWYSMELSSGSWERAVDILRDRVGTRALESRCKVSASGLKGGEFGVPEPEERREAWDPLAWVLPKEPSVVISSLEYIRGEKAVNPLRNIGG